MTSGGPTSRQELSTRIGHEFGSAGYLDRALTHSSYSVGSRKKTGDNERMEFLGDRILGLVIAELLFENFPKSSEGGLASRLNALVRKETCADVARQIDLGQLLRMSPGEEQAGGRAKTAILGDACEALIAAIYLDGGFQAAKQFIVRFWEPMLKSVEQPPRDAKTLLQEWVQGQGMAPPRYRLVERTGPDHEPAFTIGVEVGEMAPVTATAGSKRSAEQAAAEGFLRQNGLFGL